LTEDNGDSDPLGKFNEDLRHIPNPNRPDQPLFSDVSPPNRDTRPTSTIWRFSCQLTEAEP
jgi:hypothetical protein